MKPIDFGGQRSKVKVTVDIYGNKLVKTVETKLLCATWPNLADMLGMVRGWILLILQVRGQRSRSQRTYYGNKVVNMIETKPLCISLSNLADMLRMMRGWTLLIFEVRGQKSRSQWTYMEIETKPLCISLSNLSDMLTMVNPIDLEVTVQKWRLRWVSLTNVGCAGMIRFALLYFFFSTWKVHKLM